MFRLVGLLLCFLAASPLAEVYRWVDAEGTVHFSDQPHEGAETIRIEPLQTYTPRRLPRALPAMADFGKPAAVPGYARFAFSTPQDGEAIRANNGLVPVGLVLVPGLNAAEGHRVVVTFDGQPMGGQAPLSFEIPGVSRGTHTLEAAVVDSGGTPVIQAPSVTFHVLRAGH